MTQDAFLELDRVVVRPRPAGSVSVAIRRGERLMILGAAQTGKTALLNAIAGFQPVQAGTIRLDGRSISGERPERRHVALLPARETLFPHMSLRDNIAFALRGRGVPAALLRDEAQAVLVRQGLATVAERRPARLSAEQRRRGELARALAAAPAVLLIDTPPREPPPPTFLFHTENTAVIATDDPAAALGMATRIVLLGAQGVVQTGTPQDLYERPATRFAARFMAPCNFVPWHGRTLAIRPHRLRVQPDGALRGTVTAVAYHGASTAVTVATEAGDMVADMASLAQPVAPDQEVALAWGDEDAWPLPDAAA